MYSINYSEQAYLSIDNFVNWYKKYFISLYTDTWIDDENIIINNYIEVWNKLHNNIKSKIEHSLNENKILWIHIDDKNNKYIVLNLDNIRIFVYYIEDIKQNIRYLESIIFYKK